MYLVDRGYSDSSSPTFRKPDTIHSVRVGKRACAAYASSPSSPNLRSLRLEIDRPDALAAIDSLALPGVGSSVTTTMSRLGSALGCDHPGLGCPNAVGLVGMDHTPLSAVTLPPLTTVGYDLRASAYNLITTALHGIGEPVEDRDRLDINFALVPGGTA